MACSGCSTGYKEGGAPGGCQSKGHCASGGCNRLNTYDWLTTLDIEDVEHFNVVEVSFKNGARKAFYYNQPYTRATTGDLVVVETQAGSDVGRISLSGELVRLQMRKKRVKEDYYFPKIVRKANERDLEKFQEVREQEKPMMVRARAISRMLDLNMKIGDVEYQADGRKATFFYTADGRVDFRELIRHFAKEFKVKIEMRQIGARQESARVGGIGPCGRELCCSTWLTTYRTVSTAAARYQNLAINQAKLSGQCGRLKCCLNYELDTYMEALSNFPEDAEKLRTKNGLAVLVKTDIFKGLMYYSYDSGPSKGRFYALDLEQARIVREMNQKGELPNDLSDFQVVAVVEPDDEHRYEDVTGAVELPPDEHKRRKKKKKNKVGDRPPAKDGAMARPPRPEGEKRREDRPKNKGSGDRREGGEKREARSPQQPRPPRAPGDKQEPRSQQPRPPRPPGEKTEGGGKGGGKNRGRNRGGRDRRGRDGGNNSDNRNSNDKKDG